MLQRLRTEKKKLLGGCLINKAGRLMLIVSKSTENFFFKNLHAKVSEPVGK